MKPNIFISFLIFTITLLFQANPVFSQPEANIDKTLSPYFLVKSDNPEIDQLPLKSTSAKVNISGVIADVIVSQVYKNEGQSPIEAVYIFPASTRAAVYGLKMTIGERTIIAKIKKREEARQDYEQAKQQGKSASLLEQQRPNVFQMNVANILPGDEINVELRYTELLIPVNKIYEFVYPTVVGPRYSEKQEGSAPSSENWLKNPYLHQGEGPSYTFDLDVRLSTGIPIKEVTCPSHKVNIRYSGPSLASIDLDQSEEFGGNRDFILKYRLAGNRVQTGMLLFEGEEENFFLLMLQPPELTNIEIIPPREYIFIVDVSGSMHGFPLDISKRLLKDLIGNIRQSDLFNVLLFAGGSSIMSEQSLPATPENIQRAINLIERQRGGGGTRILPAMQKALALPGTEGFSRSVIIATDGYVAVEEEAFDLIRNNLGQANMFTFGIGSSVNRHLIEGMARVGLGEPFVITSPEEAAGKANQFRKLIQSPVLTNIRVDYGQFKAYDIEPLSIPDVMAERPIIVFGKWRGKPTGKIKISGISGEEPYHQEINLSKIKPDQHNQPLRYLWARHRIALLSDYNRLHKNDERVREVTSLGLTYNLMTAYTSFIAIDNRIRNKDGQSTTVKQPLPLPHGVSDYAVGGRVLKTPKYSSLTMSQPGSVKIQEALRSQRKAADALVEGEERDKEEKTEKTILELKEVIVPEGLSSRPIEKLLNQNLELVQSCLEKYLQKQGTLKEIKIRMTIAPGGTVSNIKVIMPRDSNIKLEACLLSKLKNILFSEPKVRGNIEVTVIYVVR